MAVTTGMMAAMDLIIIAKRKEEGLTGEVFGKDIAAAGADGKITMMSVIADMKGSGRSTGDRDLPPNNTGACKHLSTTLIGMYV